MNNKSTMMILGSNLFLNLESKDDKFSKTLNYKLNKKYNLYNFSSKNYNSNNALNELLKILNKNLSFEYALIEIGYCDILPILNDEYTLKTYKENIIQIINVLNYFKIKTTIYTIPSNQDFQLYDIDNTKINILINDINTILKDLAYENDLKIKYLKLQEEKSKSSLATSINNFIKKFFQKKIL